MVASDGNEVRKWMGNFTDKVVAKHTARLGQAFSSSDHGATVPQEDFQMIPDIVTETNGKIYTFSDGIGKISPEFAKEISLKVFQGENISAYQIRFGRF
eukprot:TRINITY_DN11166_c0_g1_i1.p1 TRINITY_DN11166_c0_g1~~TRINITY_DN11166_c0_g1_i1.p1  ORF type:complete len:99 (+),score=21.00 TRINITY_DN11166_c0_g1_i1:303-599(+)